MRGVGVLRWRLKAAAVLEDGRKELALRVLVVARSWKRQMMDAPQSLQEKYIPANPLWNSDPQNCKMIN